MKISAIIAAFYFFFFFSGISKTSAQTLIRSEVNKNEITIGEVLVYTIFLEYPDQTRWISEPVTDFKNFEVTRIQDYPVEKKYNRIYRRTDYLLTTFQLDTFLIPAPVVYFLNNKDTLKTEARSFVITVRSVLDSASSDIRPEKPIIEGKIQWTALIFTLIAVLVIVILLIRLAWRLVSAYWLARRERVRSIPPIVLTPEEKALKALNALRQRRLPELGEFKLYHTEIANIIRTYIEEQFHIPAMEMPTSELMRAFNQIPAPPPKWLQTLHEFLDICDKVKFAKFPSSNEICRALDQQAEKLIRESIPEVKQENLAEVL